MPFGDKPDAGGRTIRFNEIYASLIRPAIDDAGLEPIRADEESGGGLIHKAMFERLVLCDYAVADLTTANANVYYELGVRHATRPFSTVLVYAADSRLPFDLGPMRAIPYPISPDGLPGAGAAAARKAIATALDEARRQNVDSPLFQLLDGMQPQNVDHSKTDTFRTQVRYAQEVKERLARARDAKSVAAVKGVEESLGKLADQEAGVLVDLLLSYRDVKGFAEMIALAESVPDPLRRTVLFREQKGFALNRAGRGDEAARVLTEVIQERGPSSETCGLLGRVYKDRWEQASKAGRVDEARGHLRQAIKVYRQGFVADPRDGFPGVNAVTLMELDEPPDPDRVRLIPVVRYAAERRIATGTPDYWDWATLVELDVLARDEKGAREGLSNALALKPAGWEAETTARNLRLIHAARTRRGEGTPWVAEMIATLERAAS